MNSTDQPEVIGGILGCDVDVVERLVSEALSLLRGTKPPREEAVNLVQNRLGNSLRSAIGGVRMPGPDDFLKKIHYCNRRRARKLSIASLGTIVVVTLLISLEYGFPLHKGAPIAHRHYTGGQVPMGPLVIPSARTPASSRAPGTVLRDCNSANLGQLPADWREESLRVGPLWFVYGNELGYVHYDKSGRATAARGHGDQPYHLRVMIVNVAYGSIAVMRASKASHSYFHFVSSFYSGGGRRIPSGDNGFTFVGCPRTAQPSPNGKITSFNLGFDIEDGHSAPVSIWWPGLSRPVRVILM